MPSWIPYASNWISCNNWQKTNFEPVPRLLAVGFYVISQPILDFGLSCGTLRVSVSLAQPLVEKSCLGQGMNQKI